MVEVRDQGGEERDAAAVGHPKSPIAAREEEILAFWNKEGIFKKSLEKPSPKGEYVTYDGPPFATGLPHYGHLLQSALKDAIPRYRTMQGYHVPRRWGWDCHGLPLENQIEAELGIKTKRQIEELGVEKFNKAARDAVLRYAEDWKRIIPRFGRWVDMENDYRTMDASYTESVWWAFKKLYNRDLVYEGFKSMHFCPRCGTTLSNNEVALGYKDIEDYAVTVKLPLVDEPGTSLLVWTTTPWTLPGNAAAAVKADSIYIKVKVGEENFIVAKDRASAVFGEGYEIVGEITGKELVGKRYEPPFDYFKEELHKHKTHAWKVYAGDFVTMDDGTGIVHIAPAFGEDDLKLAQANKIPLIHHVTDEGKFIATVRDFVHLPVKPKGNPKETDEKVVAWLKEHNLLFKAELYKHSYPHCWRCDTPLLNWASNSWFVNVQSIKSNLVAQNAKVHWVPEHVGRGRFGKLLESAPDWAISRSRYWGAPIPVWRHTKTKEVRVAGSVDELLGLVRRSGNKYFLMRHGEAQSNVQRILDNVGDPSNHLTEKGVADAAASAKNLKGKGIDMVIMSPMLRARETAAIVQKELGLPDSAVMVDERLREVEFGVFNGKTHAQWHEFYNTLEKHFDQAPEGGGETYADIRRRMGEVLFEIERRYINKNVLIISHGNPLWLMEGVARRASGKQLIREGEHLLGQAEVRQVSFSPYPHNENYELDLHRPYIDEVPTGDSMNGEWKRVPDVFDCWFESGSMPYASNGYPQHTDVFNPRRLMGLWPKGYPADFIAESIDQTRGWFYSLIVLGVALFGRSPYKAVVTNGLVLAEDGRKMSKKLKNYPDPMELVERFGADAVRYYLLSSTVIRGEDLRFSARGVEEVSKKLLMRLDNVNTFYGLYEGALKEELKSDHILDRWILARLNETINQTTSGYENYELDEATRPLMSFVDDLSTWYIRRSRDRFKEEGEDREKALSTLHFVLKTTAKIMAPVMPFYAEHLFQSMKGEGNTSVHLCDWPKAGEIDSQLITEMKQVRTLASEGLQMREKAGLKLRQPLAQLKAKSIPKNPELQVVLKDELNIKEVVEDASLEVLWLDTVLTPELKEEGMVRDLARRIQEWRKEQKMQISDRPSYTLEGTDEEKLIAKKYKSELVEQTGLNELIIE